MLKNRYTIRANEPLTRDVYRMRLEGCTAHITAPGQFVHIELPGFYLRRPISVCDWDAEGFTIIYKTVGRGTRAMAAYPTGDTLDILTGLGNGFDTGGGEQHPLLVGGGVGVPPLYGLAKALLAQGKPVTAILGFNSAPEVFYPAEFAALGCRVLVTTADGGAGRRGFVTDALSETPDCDYFYACGPEPMLRALSAATGLPGQLSFEARMACGTGVCMGCSCQTLAGAKRVCADGPVFRKEEVLWRT